MCGRFVLKSKFGLIVDAFSPLVPKFEPALFEPRYNIAPTQSVPIVTSDAQAGRALEIMKWGFVPRWSKDGKSGPINARAETAATLPTFRDAFQHRRCLIPADGFYEWMKTPEGKRPHLMTMRDGGIFAFAGLWEESRGARTFTILTTRPNELLAPIHDRMPVIVPRGKYGEWLTPGPAPADVIASFPAKDMNAVEVSTLVNSPKNDVEGCIAPLV